MLQSGHIMLQCGHIVLRSGHTMSGTQPALIQLVLGDLSGKMKGSGRDADPSRPPTHRLWEYVELYLSSHIFLDGMKETTCHRSKICRSDPIGNLMYRLWQGSTTIHLWHKSASINLGHRSADRQLRYRSTDIHIGHGSADMHLVHRPADGQVWHRYPVMHLRHRYADIHLYHIYYYNSIENLNVKTRQFLKLRLPQTAVPLVTFGCYPIGFYELYLLSSEMWRQIFW